MVLVELEIAVADATENTDLLLNSKWASESKVRRRIVAAALTGSAAVSDTILEFSAGGLLFSRLENSNVGLVPGALEDYTSFNQFLGGGRELEVLCVDAAATNAVMLVLVFDRVNLSSRVGVRRRF